MSLTPGSRLGQYEVSARIGVGGMGEVYRAVDTVLERQVAIKVLPDLFASDPERLARFDREAKALAALNHSNIAQIYGVEQAGGTRALIMELVDGESLADRIERGPVPLDETLAIARQIADALEAAHEQAIVHRDLKPANVRLRPDGSVKVLDFGLAKALGGDAVDAAMADSPTLSLGATRAGVILGTAAYMSPEQASGRAIDRRTDIWSFGVVLYELLAGRKAFAGESVSDTVATVLKLDPDWNAVPADTPDAIRLLLRRCLTKDRKQRLQAIGEARIVLENSDKSPAVVPALHQSRRALWTSLAAASVFAFAFAAVSFVHFGERPVARIAPIQRFEIPMPSPQVGAAIISPDGSRLVFWEPGGRGRGPNSGVILVRELNSLNARPLTGTDNAVGLPFWSPDGRYLAFSADRKLKKIDLTSGTVEVLCDTVASIGGFWTSDGMIVFSDAGRLVQVPAAGGMPSPLPGFSGRDANDRLPIPLPDGRHFLFTRPSRDAVTTYVAVRDDPAGQPTKLIDASAQAFTPAVDDPNAGYVLFLRNATESAFSPPIGTLMAQRFDTRRLALEGTPVPVMDRASLSSVSRTNVLAATQRPAEIGDQLTVFDRQGNVLQKLGESDEYSRVSFSPDGLRVIATRSASGAAAPGDRQLWMFDLARSLASRFPTDPGGAFFPVWSPDGTHIVFASERGGKRNLYRRLSNGGGEDELLLTPDENVTPLSWSRDGRYLGVGATAQAQTHFVVTLDANGKVVGKPVVFVRRGLGLGIEFSPERAGPPRWIAYQATRDQRTEIYLREFDPSSPTLTPARAGEWQVSKGGGSSVRWNPDGKELLYLAPDRTLMAVDFTGSPNAPTGLPRPVFKPAGFDRASAAGVATLSWAISPDGKKFLFPIPVTTGTTNPPLIVTLNWTTSLLKQDARKD